jgi:hypothetical protein
LVIIERAILEKQYSARSTPTTHHAVEALWRHIEEVAAHLNADAGVVDEAVERAEGREQRLRHLLAALDRGDVAGDEGRLLLALADAGERLGGGLVLGEVEHDHVEARLRQREGDAPPDALLAAGDRGDGRAPHAQGRFCAPGEAAPIGVFSIVPSRSGR